MSRIFSMTIDPHAANKSWVVYRLFDADGIVQYIGHCRLSQMTSFPDARGHVMFAKVFPAGANLTLEVLSIYVDRLSAKNAIWDYFKDNPRPLMNNMGVWQGGSVAVRCVETGEVFDSIHQCAKAHGLTTNALSRHLAGKIGFKSVKGKTYERAVPSH